MANIKLEGKLVSFTSKSGLKIKSEVLKVVTGTDDKLYVRVKYDGKYYLKQKDSVKIVENKSSKQSKTAIA